MKTKDVEPKHPNTKVSDIAKQINAILLEIGKLKKSKEQFLKDISILKEAVNEQVNYAKGFYDGRRYVVSKAETFLLKELGFANREALADAGKLPAWWIITLVECLTDPPIVAKVINITEVSDVQPQTKTED